MYNINVCCHYIFLYNDSKYFMIHESVHGIIRYDIQYKCFLLLYKKLYNNKHFLIYESVYLIIREDV